MITNASMSKSTIVTKSGFKYIVTQSPDPNNLQNYKDFLLNNCVTTVVKLCTENRYEIEFLEHHGINVINIPLSDGSTPSAEVISQWVGIIKKLQKEKKQGVAVHCVSGLGRAPLFVCVTIIKIDKTDPIDTITNVRKTIPRALNTVQIKFLEALPSSNETKGGRCTIC